MAQLSYPLDNTLYTASYPQFWLSTRTQGVFSSNDLSVTASTGMQIIVNPGIAWLKFSRFISAGYANTTTTGFTLATADGLYARIDRVVIRWDNITNDITLQVKKGTPGSSPVAPALQRNSDAYEIAIADITVNAGTLQISQANVKDTRLDENLCGVMRDGVTGIPTQTLYDQWWSWFSALRTDAETKASEFTAWMALFKSQNESDLALWLANFKAQSTADFDAWFLGFKDSNSEIYNTWYTAFTSTSEDDFSAWFEHLQNELDANQAANLQNQIDQHKATGITNQPDGVHNLRLKDGKLQVFIGIGWATLAALSVGYTAGYFDSRSFTAQSFDIIGYKAGVFDNQIEVEE